MNDDINEMADVSVRSKEQLNEILNEDSEPGEDFVVLNEKIREKVALRNKAKSEAAASPESVETITVSTARTGSQILESVTGRQRARIVLLTKDSSIMQEGSESYRRMTDLRTQFLEIHIVVLNLKTEDNAASIFRLYTNVWLYKTNSTAWWRMSYDAYMLARAQLIFSGGFRADIIIADDLFEAGLAGWFLSKKCKRPLQLHISEDFYEDSFINSHEYPTLYGWSVEYLLKRATSVRTKTEPQRQAVIFENKKLEGVTELLPNYYNLEAWKDFAPTNGLHEKYPQFKFIILTISSLRTSSHSMEVLLGCSQILRQYPTVGLVIVGSGPLRAQLEKTAIALGLQSQIEFEPMPAEVISYMKSANALVHLSEDSQEDNLILEAAVSKLPMVANISGLAGKLFVQGESAALCDIHDPKCIQESINNYLNRNQDRTIFAQAASEIVFDRIEQDYSVYVRAYAQSIERCMVAVS